MCSKPCQEAEGISDTLLVCTRKGLFTVARKSSSWEITGADFLGQNVSIALTDPRDGCRYAALDHGHFGVKLHRSTANGWEEIAAPVYPQKPEGREEIDFWGRPLAWSTARIWALAAGGADQEGVIWCGTLPGGLFRSADHGESWQMMRSLWDHPLRKKWNGGGADLPGLHSICVDPRDSSRVWIAVSTGGVWFTEDDGASWTLRGATTSSIATRSRWTRKASGSPWSRLPAACGSARTRATAGPACRIHCRRCTRRISREGYTESWPGIARRRRA